VAAGLWIEAGLAWLIGSAAIAYLALVPWLGVATARRDAEAEREVAGALSGNATEMIRGMTQLVSFGAVDRMLDRIESLDTARSRALLRGGRAGALRAGLGGLIAGGLILGAAWSLHAAVAGGNLGVAELASGLVLAWVSLEPLRALDRVVPDAMRAVGAGRRLLGLEELQVEIRGDLPTPREPLGVEVAGVSYERGGRPILDGVTFDVVPGSSVGLVGASGSGKSTLLDLIAGLRLPSAGSVRVAGVEVRQLDAGSLRSEVQLVSQRADLFHGTIESNLRLASPRADEVELRRALDTAGLSDWIGDVGLDAEIGELGRSISGGEAQRLSLARALLSDPRILLLDEVTSALDSKNEEHVLDAILGTPGRTTFVVSHRLEIMQRVDRILVMERGALVEDGPHSELIERGGPYAALWATHRDLLEIG
jgi:ATP-binding cassette subfamily C protein/ATP-binding cassette subfamily C protein CydC